MLSQPGIVPVSDVSHPKEPFPAMTNLIRVYIFHPIASGFIDQNQKNGYRSFAQRHHDLHGCTASRRADDANLAAMGHGAFVHAYHAPVARFGQVQLG